MSGTARRRRLCVVDRGPRAERATDGRVEPGPRPGGRLLGVSRARPVLQHRDEHLPLRLDRGRLPPRRVSRAGSRRSLPAGRLSAEILVLQPLRYLPMRRVMLRAPAAAAACAWLAAVIAAGCGEEAPSRG